MPEKTCNSFLKSFTSILCLSIVFLACQEKQYVVDDEGNTAIRINQLGYYPKAPKKAIVVSNKAGTNFELIDLDKKTKVYSGQLSETTYWELSDEQIRVGDFSDFTRPGQYVIHIEGVGYSYPFDISSSVLSGALTGSIKGLYYQRAGMELEEKYAKKWQRAAGHPDDSILFHPSSGRTEGHTQSPGGWYDAGDYNKYVVNGAFPLGQLFLLQEQYPELTNSLKTNIPDNYPGMSDYLEELKYEMDWLLTMQDIDGGLYHKLTTINFEEMVMPEKATKTRYMVGKGTAATLDFAACAAQSYRLFRNIDAGYADQCLKASKKAWLWALNNPNIAYKNPEDIHTGPYDDTDFQDEWYWAACELYLSTKQPAFLDYIIQHPPEYSYQPGESWSRCMRYTGMFSLLNHKESLPKELVKDIETHLLLAADDLVKKTQQNAYFQPIDRFVWGSNSDVANAAIVIAQAYRITRDSKYLKGVQESADYLFGKNATGYSFLTGFGDLSPQFIHHRQSASDGIDEPVPGLLSGGPNIRQEDSSSGAIYPANIPPMKSWVDQEPSYASNEICLNWNAPLTYILGFLEAESD